MERLSAYALYQLTGFLAKRKGTDFFEAHPNIPDPSEVEEVLAKLNHTPEAIFDNVELVYDLLCREQYRRLWQQSRENGLFATLLELSALYYTHPSMDAVFHEICEITGDGPSLELAVRIFYDTDRPILFYADAALAWKYLKYLFPEAANCDDFFHVGLQADARLVAFLTGSDASDVRLEGFAQRFYPEDELAPWFGKLHGGMPRAIDTQEIMEESGHLAYQITGEARSGRRFLVKQIAKATGLHLLLVDFELMSQSKAFHKNWNLILRELFLQPSCLCLYHIRRREEETGGEDLNWTLREMERTYMLFGKPMFYLTDKEVKLVPFLDSHVQVVEIKPFDSSECYHMWKAFLEKYGVGDLIDPRSLASVMNLPAGQMDQICAETARCVKRGSYQKNDIFRICYQILDDGRYDNVKRVAAGYSWEELKLETHTKKLLRSICDQVAFRTKILEDWRLIDNYRYGKSVSAIFTGPPGTGKTMAAQVLANELGLEIYKVDLSQIVDKYIGETEKRLEEVFNRAEKSHMILFFDEADAILGKRSDVKDAKDKYANTEVSYLLQRMEEYDGIVLMATNNYNNIDSAFIRRFRFEVPFYQPGPDRRKEIWQMLLTDSIPTEEIDVNYLANTFEITGAVIKNIVLNACFDAAADGGVLKMEHMIRAVCREMKKNGKVVIAADLKEYEHFITEDLL